MGTENHSKNAKWIKKTTTCKQSCECLKKILRWKYTPMHSRHHFKCIKLENSWPGWHIRILVQKIHLHPWQTCYRNKKKMYTENWDTWMDDQKEPLKGTAPDNYRPITCQLIVWKILWVHITAEIYYSLISHGIIPEEQKGCRKRTRGTGGLLYIDQHILNDSKTRRKYLAMTWIDYKKPYDMVPPKLDTTLSQNVWNTRPSRTVYWEDHGNLENRIDTRRKKFSQGNDPLRHMQGDTLSPLLFVIAMKSLHQIFKKCTAGC